MNHKKIGILGCGWLGLPLAISLINKGHTISGSTTTIDKLPKLEKQGIIPHILSLGKSDPSIYLDFFAEKDIIIINFPPKRIPNIIDIYQSQIRSILPYISATQKVIFVSSTSVYQNTNDFVTEDLIIKPEKESGIAVSAVENILKEHLNDRLTIIRFSGLIGYDRVPGRFLANKKEVRNGHAPINVIHRDDCIGLIEMIIAKKYWGHTINGVSDKHPLRKDFYTLAANKAGLIPPTFAKETQIDFKLISNKKSKQDLGYTYIHPDPIKLVE